jgi:hypothetical protein
MKKQFFKTFALGLIISITSCNSFSVITISDVNYGISCPNPQYVGTMYKSSSTISLNDSSASFVNSPFDLQLSALLKDARKKYGVDVTIQNVRWDVKNGKKKVGVVYDVIRCK